MNTEYNVMKLRMVTVSMEGKTFRKFFIIGQNDISVPTEMLDAWIDSLNIDKNTFYVISGHIREWN